MAHDVFISYSTQDKTVADAMCATLENRKIRCWIAPRDVLPGVSYAEALIDALNRSRVIVLVFSKSANNSPQVMREIERAVNKGIPIIPFRIENVMPSKAMEYFLSAPHWLDALTPPLEKHLQRLTDTVKVLLAEVGKSQAGAAEQVPLTPPSVKWWKRIRQAHVIAGSIVLIVAVTGIIYLVNSFGKEEKDSISALPTSTPNGTPSITTTSTPASSATSPIPKDLLFEDDFNDPDSGWLTRLDEMAEFGYENGEFSIVIKQDNIKTWAYSSNIGELADFIVEIDVKPVNATNQDDYGLVFRWQEPLSEENIYYFGITTDGRYTILKKEIFIWSRLRDWTTSAFIHKGYVTNRLKVVCTGNQLSVYINETHLSTVMDTSFTKGWLGLSVTAYTSPVHVHFDNIKVYDVN